MSNEVKKAPEHKPSVQGNKSEAQKSGQANQNSDNKKDLPKEKRA